MSRLKENPIRKRWRYTVLLAPQGSDDSFCAHVLAENAGEAVQRAREECRRSWAPTQYEDCDLIVAAVLHGHVRFIYDCLQHGAEYEDQWKEL
jgi:hypothetical protein